jgi:toxin ParE1/3/4
MTLLVIATRFTVDISQIRMHLEEVAGKATAQRYLGQFERAARRLSEMPRSGFLRPALGPDTRRLVIRPYVLIYDYSVEDDTVTLLRLVHGRRKITPAMLPEM